jgi:hypothetical protein
VAGATCVGIGLVDTPMPVAPGAARLPTITTRDGGSMSVTTTPRPTSVRRPRTALRRLLTVLAATGSGLAGWMIAGPIGGIDLTARQGGSTSEVGPAAVVVTAVAVGLAGWAALAGLERIAVRARAVWTALAVLTLVGSLLGPLAAATNGPARVSLAALHLIVGAVLIGGLRRTAPAR